MTLAVVDWRVLAGGKTYPDGLFSLSRILWWYWLNVWCPAASMTTALAGWWRSGMAAMGDDDDPDDANYPYMILSTSRTR